MTLPRTGALTLALALGLLCAALPAHAQTVVISQAYGGGGNAGAPFTHDFVELHNVGQAPVVVDGMSIQYAPASGFSNFGQNPITTLSGTIPAGGYFLVRLAGGASGAALPAADLSGTTDLNPFSGKVVLSRTADPLVCNGGSSPCDGLALSRILDLLGYGTADFFEGANGAAQGASNTVAVARAGAGCADTNDNLADFAAGAPAPRNSASSAVTCASAPAPPPFQPPACVPSATIAAIQGTGTLSGWLGSSVSTSGVVTARYAGADARGFFMQMPVGDGDPATSDGIFVSTGTSDPPADAAAGNEVCVEGVVGEALPATDFFARPTTNVSATRVVLVGTGRPLPAPVTITSLPAGSALDALERFEGMRVRVSSLTVVSPTSGIVDEATGTAASTGVFFGVLTGVARPIREPGVDVHDGLPAEAPPDVPVFDANLERIRVESAGLGRPAIDVATGATVTNLVGPLHYGERTPTILVDSAPGLTASTQTAAANAAPAPRTTEFTVASLNFGGLFDTTDSEEHQDAVPTPEALARQLAKLSLHVRSVLRNPDFLAVEDVETLAVLQSLASRINADAVAAGQPDPGYQAFLIEGQAASGLDVGLLAKSSRVTVTQVVQEGRDATFFDPYNGFADRLHDQPPLVVRATVALSSGTVSVTAIVAHLSPLQGIADPWSGSSVRAKRAAQSEFLAGLVQDRQAAAPNDALVVAGDFNGYHFNDGYVDVTGTVAGAPVGAAFVTQATADIVDPNLSDALAEVAAASRYSSTEGGNAESRHQVLVNEAAAGLQSRAVIAHGNADFPDVFRNDASRAERAAANDAPVVYFEVEAPAPSPTPVPPAGPVDITAKVKVKIWRSFYFWRHRGYTYALVDVTNLTPKSFTGPFHLAITGLPAGAQVVNARVAIDGAPAVPVFWWKQLRPFHTMRAWVVLKGVPTSVTPTIKVYAGKLVALN